MVNILEKVQGVEFVTAFLDTNLPSSFCLFTTRDGEDYVRLSGRERGEKIYLRLRTGSYGRVIDEEIEEDETSLSFTEILQDLNIQFDYDDLGYPLDSPDLSLYPSFVAGGHKWLIVDKLFPRDQVMNAKIAHEGFAGYLQKPRHSLHFTSFVRGITDELAQHFPDDATSGSLCYATRHSLGFFGGADDSPQKKSGATRKLIRVMKQQLVVGS